MSKPTVSPVSHHEVETVFKHILPLLEKVYDRTGFSQICSPMELLKDLKERSLQLWVAWLDSGEIVSFAVTRLDVYPVGKACTVLASGHSDEYKGIWEEYIQPIEDWAKDSEGCSIMYVNGRIGWKRVLAESGYEFDSITLSKVLSNEDHNLGDSSVEQIH